MVEEEGIIEYLKADYSFSFVQVFLDSYSKHKKFISKNNLKSNFLKFFITTWNKEIKKIKNLRKGDPKTFLGKTPVLVPWNKTKKPFLF